MTTKRGRKRYAIPRCTWPVLLLMLLARAPASHAGEATAASTPTRPRYEPMVLDNGLRVFFLEDHARPTIAIVTWYRVGSKDEAKGKTGFAHLFEHMMFKGSAHAPDGLMDHLIEAAGGWTNAFTSNDMTVYQDVASSSFLEPALWLEADRMAGLTDTLDQAKLDNQRDVVRNERRQRNDNQPYGMAPRLIAKALWPEDFGYHWDTIGEHEDLIAATTDDVKAFFTRYYVPNNATMVIAGDFDPAAAAALVQKYFGWIPRAPEPDRPRYQAPKPITREVVLTATDKVQVPRVYLTWRGPAVLAKAEPALDIAALILGGGKTSRLYKRLVYDERLAQDVSAHFRSMELGGEFSIVATAKPGIEPARIIQVISEEVARLAKEPPTEAEVERARNRYEVAFLTQSSSLLARAHQIASYDVQAHDPNFFDRDLARYRAVVATEVQAVAGHYLTPSCRVTLTIHPEQP